MVITNKLGLPAPVVRAVTPKKDPTSRRGGADISVTELIGPPKVIQLKERNWDRIVEDASELLYSLYGTIGHDILKRNANPGELSEQRLRMVRVVDGRTWRISGQFDIVTDDAEGRLLTDYKFTSAWRVAHGSTDDYEAQMNVYRVLLRDNGIDDVTGIRNVLFLRDWNEKGLSEESYPRNRVVVMKQPLWSAQKAENYIERRLRAHAVDLPDCTAEERWARDGQLAVQIVGGKRALRLVDEDKPEEAEKFAANYMQEYPTKKLEIVHRPGKSTRCEKFCPMLQWCLQGLALVEGEAEP